MEKQLTIFIITFVKKINKVVRMRQKNGKKNEHCCQNKNGKLKLSLNAPTKMADIFASTAATLLLVHVV